MISPVLILTLALLSPSLGYIRKFNQLQKQIDDGIGKFGIDLHKNLMKQWYSGGENVMASPISVYFSLAMAHLATTGETRDEIRSVMGLPMDEELSHHVLGELFKSLQHSAHANVSLYNGLFLQAGNVVKDSYIEQIKKYYDSYITSVDFTGGDATDAINRWFETKTGGKISRFFDQAISQDVKLMLVNVLTMSGTWDRQFSPENTKMETFQGDDGHEEQVSMMHKTDFVLYFDNVDENFEAVGMPLRNGEHYLYIILPHEGSQLREIMGNMDYDTIQQIISGSVRRTVDIKLPKFWTKVRQQIKDTMRLMGVHKLFTSPDLGNMLVHASLRVTQMLHAAEWRMDEQGIDASAGTTQEYRIYDQHVPNEDVKEFYVQKPFTFFIHHPATKSIMYYGSIHKITDL